MEHTGVVKSFSPLKGWGFVTSEEAGGDLLLLKTELGGYCAQKGDQVSFTVRETPKGLQAAGVKVISTQDGTYSFFGVVKSYNENKGFGFLGCDAAMNIFGKDVFFMRSQVPQGLQTGAQVMFKAEQKERGPQAVGEVQAMGPMGAPQPMQGYAQMGGGGGYMGGAGGGYMGGAGGGYMGGGGGGYMGGAGGGYMSQLGAPMVPVTGMGGMGMSHPGMGAPPLPSPNQMLYGTIKQINQEKGWGHITCKALEKFLGKADIFVLPTSMAEVPGATAGAEVSFNVSAGNKGPHAINIKFCEISAAAGQSFSGTVSSFNPGKGWGFIESPQAKELFGTDIFFHQKAVVGDAVAAGDWVSFSIDVSGGRPSGANVEKVAGGDGGGGAYGGGYGKAAVTSAVPSYSPY